MYCVGSSVVDKSGLIVGYFYDFANTIVKNAFKHFPETVVLSCQLDGGLPSRITQLKNLLSLSAVSYSSLSRAQMRNWYYVVGVDELSAVTVSIFSSQLDHMSSKLKVLFACRVMYLNGKVRIQNASSGSDLRFDTFQFLTLKKLLR